MDEHLSRVAALTFDVFGTIVDWRASVIRACRALRTPLVEPVNWPAVVNTWRERYRPTLDRVRRGEIAWQPLDDIHRLTLEEALDAHGVRGLTEALREQLVMAWHRLEPWPDAIAGLTRIRQRFITATLSNASLSMLTDLVRHGDLPFDHVLSAELARAYKPDPRVYRAAAMWLGLPPERVMMVAAHPYDLEAAAAVGFRTAYLDRPTEWGRDSARVVVVPTDVDVAAADLVDLARLLDQRVSG